MLDNPDREKVESVCDDQRQLMHALDEVCLTMDNVEVLWLLYKDASDENKRYFRETFEEDIIEYIEAKGV